MLNYTVSNYYHRVWAAYDWFGSFIFTAYVGNFAQKWVGFGKTGKVMNNRFIGVKEHNSIPVLLICRV